jgi:uncharacterized protein
MPPLSPTPTGVSLSLLIQPRASRSELVGVRGDVLRIRLAAPPVDGAANEALVRLLADLLEVPRARIRIAAGLGSRRKRVEVSGLAVGEVARRLGLGGP